MSNSISGTGKRRVKRTYEVTRKDDGIISAQSASPMSREEEEAGEKGPTPLQPKKSRYDPNKTFSFTKQGSEDHTVSREQLSESERRASNYGTQSLLKNEVSAMGKLVHIAQNQADNVSSSDPNGGEDRSRKEGVVHKQTNTKKSEKENRQRMWEEQQLQNSMATKTIILMTSLWKGLTNTIMSSILMQ